MSAYDLIRRIEALEGRVAALEKAGASDTTREVLAEKYREKFGRPPHHFMRTEKIMEALANGR